MREAEKLTEERRYEKMGHIRDTLPAVLALI